MFKLATKLKRLKGVLKIWNKEKFGNVISNLKEAEEKVKRLEEIFDSSGTDSDLIHLNKAKAIHLRSMAEEETFWQQKARMKWLQEGDQNTKLFHNSVAVKHGHVSITRIKIDKGIWLDQEMDIKNHATESFQSLLSAEVNQQDSNATIE